MQESNSSVSKAYGEKQNKGRETMSTKEHEAIDKQIVNLKYKSWTILGSDFIKLEFEFYTMLALNSCKRNHPCTSSESRF